MATLEIPLSLLGLSDFPTSPATCQNVGPSCQGCPHADYCEHLAESDLLLADD